MYSQKEVHNIIELIKEYYSNLIRFSVIKQNEGGVFLLANDSQGSQYHLRITSDGKLFTHIDGHWKHIKNFLYRKS